MNAKILIIEDEIELSGLLKRFLIKKHCDVVCAENINSAKAYIFGDSFDVVILDNNLPDGKGFDLIKTIKMAQKSPIIIAMSALQAKDEALNAGASIYMEKPIKISQVYDVLKSTAS